MVEVNTSSQGVGSSPEVLRVSESSMMNGVSNWYRVFGKSRPSVLNTAPEWRALRGAHAVSVSRAVIVEGTALRAYRPIRSGPFIFDALRDLWGEQIAQFASHQPQREVE